MPELTGETVDLIKFIDLTRSVPIRVDAPDLIQRVLALHTGSGGTEQSDLPPHSGSYEMYVYFKEFPQIYYEIDLIRSDADGRFYLEQKGLPESRDVFYTPVPDDIVPRLLTGEP